MKYKVNITEKSTGHVKIVEMEADDEATMYSLLSWGNYSCDCNLHSFFYPESDIVFPCNGTVSNLESKYKVNEFTDENGLVTQMEE